MCSLAIRQVMVILSLRRQLLTGMVWLKAVVMHLSGDVTSDGLCPIKEIKMKDARLVPGAPPEEQQLRQLRDWLIGNEVFSRQRGRWAGGVYGLVAEMIKNSSSPTGVQYDFQQFVADMEVMVKRLAVYTRDGWEVARRELQTALTNGAYLIKGEEKGARFNDVTPVTILVFEPEKFFTLVKWVLAVGNQRDIWRGNCPESYGGEKRKYNIVGQPFDLTEKLIEELPNLWSKTHVKLIWHVLRRRDLATGTPADLDLASAYYLELARYFHQRGEIFSRYGKSTPKGTHEMYLAEGTYPEGVLDKDDDLAKGISRGIQTPLAYLYEAEQASVLRWLSREEQDHVASWQIDIPVMILRRLKGFSYKRSQFCVGFHPEEKHSHYQQERPAFASKGVQHGYGTTVIFCDERKGYMKDLPEKDKKNNEVVSKFAQNLSFFMDVAY